MTKKLMESLKHPIQSKILITIHTNGQMTAKQLAKANGSIPPATLYRHLNKMTNNGILSVVQENKIRGVVEKVYDIGVTISGNEQVARGALSGEAYMSLFTLYMMGIMDEFAEYTARDDIDIAEDGSGFSMVPVYASKEELADIGVKISSLLEPLMNNPPSPERTYHAIGLIVTPPKNIE